MKKIKLFAVSAAMLGVMSASTIQAANWLMLQGTEHPERTQRLFAFMQPSYTKDKGEPISGLVDTVAPFSNLNGELVGNNVIAPNYSTQEAIHFRRARIGSRGNFTGAFRNDFTEKMNYFFLTEWAPNLMTHNPFGGRERVAALDHFSLTFNHIPGARIRAGLFKTPGPEESMQAIFTFDYIEFTDFIAREKLERFVTGAAKLAASPGSPAMGTPTNTGYGFNAERDWGIQVFDSFKSDQWDLSYAVMIGRGEGIHETSDSDGNNETYLYLSAERNLRGGLGPWKNGIKMFAWHQSGKRQFASDTTEAEYDRKRYGIGVKALGKLFGSSYKHRITAELMFADGMIFSAPTGNVAQGPLGNGNLQIAAESGNMSKGLTLDYGFYLDEAWQFDVRFDRHNLLYKTSATVSSASERIIEAKTFGINYHFNKKNRLTFNYIMRHAEVPVAYPAALDSNIKKIVDTLGDRVALQYTLVY